MVEEGDVEEVEMAQMNGKMKMAILGEIPMEMEHLMMMVIDHLNFKNLTLAAEIVYLFSL